jgi:YVTN family beta-propeller protein
MRTTNGIAFFAGCLAVALSSPPSVLAKQPPQAPTPLALITNWGSDSVSLINIDQGKELAKIDVCLKPYDVQVEKTGRFGYVSCSGSDVIAVIDIQAMLERKDRRIKVGESPRDIDLTADGSRAVVANSGSNSISVVDLREGKEVYTVTVGTIPYGVALTTDDKLAVITCWGSNKVQLVELGVTSGKVVATFDVGSLPYTVIIPHNSDTALVTCFGSDAVYPIDLKARTAGPPIPVGRSPWGLSSSPDGTVAIVANYYSGDASILKVSAGKGGPIGAAAAPAVETGRISLSNPIGGGLVLARAKNAAFSADATKAIVTNLGNNEVMLVDLAGKRVVKTISVGQAPYGVAFVPRK